MLNQILIALAVIAGYGLFVLVRPMMSCRKCSGWGQKAGRRRKVSACVRCKGTGEVFRPGARFVHAGAALALQHWRDRTEGER